MLKLLQSLSINQHFFYFRYRAETESLADVCITVFTKQLTRNWLWVSYTKKKTSIFFSIYFHQSYDAMSSFPQVGGGLDFIHKNPFIHSRDVRRVYVFRIVECNDPCQRVYDTWVRTVYSRIEWKFSSFCTFLVWICTDLRIVPPMYIRTTVLLLWRKLFCCCFMVANMWMELYTEYITVREISLN